MKKYLQCILYLIKDSIFSIKTLIILLILSLLFIPNISYTLIVLLFIFLEVPCIILPLMELSAPIGIKYLPPNFLVRYLILMFAQDIFILNGSLLFQINNIVFYKSYMHTFRFIPKRNTIVEKLSKKKPINNDSKLEKLTTE